MHVSLCDWTVSITLDFNKHAIEVISEPRSSLTNGVSAHWYEMHNISNSPYKRWNCKIVFVKFLTNLIFSSYLYQIAHLGDEDDEPEFSSAMPLEEGDTFFFAPRPLRNLVLVDELDSLSPILGKKYYVPCYLSNFLWYTKVHNLTNTFFLQLAMWQILQEKILLRSIWHVAEAQGLHLEPLDMVWK